jgi:hypothetical protein
VIDASLTTKTNEVRYMTINNLTIYMNKQNKEFGVFWCTKYLNAAELSDSHFSSMSYSEICKYVEEKLQINLPSLTKLKELESAGHQVKYSSDNSVVYISLIENNNFLEF